MRSTWLETQHQTLAKAQRADDPEAKQTGSGMVNAGSQSRLAASMSASILGGGSTAAGARQAAVCASSSAGRAMHVQSPR